MKGSALEVSDGVYSRALNLARDAKTYEVVCLAPDGSTLTKMTHANLGLAFQTAQNQSQSGRTCYITRGRLLFIFKEGRAQWQPA